MKRVTLTINALKYKPVIKYRLKSSMQRVYESVNVGDSYVREIGNMLIRAAWQASLHEKPKQTWH